MQPTDHDLLILLVQKVDTLAEVMKNHIERDFTWTKIFVGAIIVVLVPTVIKIIATFTTTTIPKL